MMKSTEVLDDLDVALMDHVATQDVFRGCFAHRNISAVAMVVHGMTCSYPVCIDCLEKYQQVIDLAHDLRNRSPQVYQRFISTEKIRPCVCGKPILDNPITLAVRPLGGE